MADFYFYNDGTGNTDWNNPLNWWQDAGYTIPVGFAPSLTGSDNVCIYSTVNTNFPTSISFYIFNYSDIYLVNLAVDNYGFVYNYGSINIDSLSSWNDHQEINNYGSIINGGTLNVTTLSNNSGSYITNNSLLANNLVIFNYAGAITVNNNVFNNYGGVFNAGEIDNYATLSNNGSFDNYGMLYNGYIINNAANFNNFTTGLFDNEGWFNQASVFVNTGTFINNYYFFDNGAGDVNWGNTANWWFDINHTLPIGALPTILSTDTINIDSECDNITGNIFYALLIRNTVATLSGYINNSNNIVITGASTVTIAGYLNNVGYTGVNDTSELLVTGTINNLNTLEIFDYAHSDSSTGAFINTGVFNITSNNSMSINQTSYSGYFFNHGAGGSFYTATNWFYDNTLTCHITDVGAFKPTDTIIFNGTIDYADTTFNANIINNAILTLPSAELLNHYSCYNTGTLINSNIFTNTGTFSNAGNFINNVRFTNIGTMSFIASGTFTNNGSFIYGDKYSTQFKGEIFPQIPSSAGWGTAILF